MAKAFGALGRGSFHVILIHAMASQPSASGTAQLVGTAQELQASLLQAKKDARTRRAAAPIKQKLEALERMRRNAAPIRASRRK